MTILEDSKWKYHSDGHLKALIEYAAKRDLWSEVEEYAQELHQRRMVRLAKSAS